MSNTTVVLAIIGGYNYMFRPYSWAIFRLYHETEGRRENKRANKRTGKNPTITAPYGTHAPTRKKMKEHN